MAAPVVTIPIAWLNTTTTGEVRCTVDQAATVYVVASTSATQPSVAQIKAGQDHTGSAADDSGSVAITGNGEAIVTLTSLTAATTLYFHGCATNGSAEDSAVFSGPNGVNSDGPICSITTTTTTSAKQTGVPHHFDVKASVLGIGRPSEHRKIWTITPPAGTGETRTIPDRRDDSDGRTIDLFSEVDSWFYLLDTFIESDPDNTGTWTVACTITDAAGNSDSDSTTCAANNTGLATTYFDPGATGANNGTSWADAYQTITDVRNGGTASVRLGTNRLLIVRRGIDFKADNVCEFRASNVQVRAATEAESVAAGHGAGLSAPKFDCADYKVFEFRADTSAENKVVRGITFYDSEGNNSTLRWPIGTVGTGFKSIAVIDCSTEVYNEGEADERWVTEFMTLSTGIDGLLIERCNGAKAARYPLFSATTNNQNGDIMVIDPVCGQSIGRDSADADDGGADANNERGIRIGTALIQVDGFTIVGGDMDGSTDATYNSITGKSALRIVSARYVTIDRARIQGHSWGGDPHGPSTICTIRACQLYDTTEPAFVMSHDSTGTPVASSHSGDILYDANKIWISSTNTNSPVIQIQRDYGVWLRRNTIVNFSNAGQIINIEGHDAYAGSVKMTDNAILRRTESDISDANYVFVRFGPDIGSGAPHRNFFSDNNLYIEPADIGATGFASDMTNYAHTHGPDGGAKTKAEWDALADVGTEAYVAASGVLTDIEEGGPLVSSALADYALASVWADYAASNYDISDTVNYGASGGVADIDITAQGVIGTQIITLTFAAAVTGTPVLGVKRNGLTTPFSEPGAVSAVTTIEVELASALLAGSTYVVNYISGLTSGGEPLIPVSGITVTLVSAVTSGQRSRDRSRVLGWKVR